jgi:hypothetical protein
MVNQYGPEPPAPLRVSRSASFGARITLVPGQSRCRFVGLLGALIASALLSACGDNEPVDTAGGQELLSRVQTENYREWARAPGWESRRPSISGGHGGELDIYVNDTIAAVLDGGQTIGAWLTGSTIVKDVWNGSTLHAIAIMDKRADGWYWAEFKGTGEVLAAGHPQGCLDCHERADDYVRAFALP